MKRRNWDDLRAFMAIAGDGSFRSASKRTGFSPATLSRMLDRLEADLNMRLLDRSPEGCVLTEAGHGVEYWVSAMQACAVEIDALANQRSDRQLRGTVRINSDEWVSYCITRAMPEFRRLAPEIEIEVLTSSRPYNLALRETDIVLCSEALRGKDVITRHLGLLTFSLYGRPDVAAANANLVAEGRWSEIPLVGFDESRSHLKAEEWIRSLSNDAKPWLRCSYALGIMDGVMNGGGLGLLADFAVENFAKLSPIAVAKPPLSTDIWLCAHRSIVQVASVKAVTSFLVDLFGNLPSRRDALRPFDFGKI